MAGVSLVPDLMRNARWAVTNRIRLLSRSRPDYVILTLSGSFPERTARPRRPFPLSLLPWPPPPVSVEAFDEALELLATDPRVKGAILVMSGLSAGPATLSSLGQAVARFRESGKRAIAYLPDIGLWPYTLACACDEILAPESATFHAAGLWAETLFLKDTLAMVGIEADFESIAEYKVAPDMFRRSKMTEPHREMLESILDSIHGQVVGTISRGRGLSEQRVQELQDRVPLTAEDARVAGLLDGVCYADELATHLGEPGKPAGLIPWEQAHRRLVHPLRWRSGRAIGVISLEGLIVSGPSRQPPLPIPLPPPLRTQQAGSDTLIAQLRAAATYNRLAAVVLHVDSPGGSALASDLIWREVARLRTRKPVVVYMGDVAASGGYYVSAAANAILCQGLTMTGSIGIWGGKFVSQGLYSRILARREVASRGQAAGMWADAAPFSDEERGRIRANLGANYDRFKSRVVEGRGLTEEAVEALARGRQWTGEQALALGLVDGLGNLRACAERARELANLDPRRTTPLVPVPVPRRAIPPLPSPSGAAEWLAGLAGLLRERVLATSPWQIWIRG
jgi:protease-4